MMYYIVPAKHSIFANEDDDIGSQKHTHHNKNTQEKKYGKFEYILITSTCMLHTMQ